MLIRMPETTQQTLRKIKLKVMHNAPKVTPPIQPHYPPATPQASYHNFA